MAVELQVLVLAALLQMVQFLLVSIPANLQLGSGKFMSPRDPERLGKPLQDQLHPITGRLFRAFNNHFEGLILFTIAVVAVVLGDKSTGLTEACAHIYLIARLIYIPAYAQGLSPWRSLIWLVGFGATGVMLVSTLF
ncbi:MAG: MAPEG family protein [Pseudomonadota bacterium]